MGVRRSNSYRPEVRLLLSARHLQSNLPFMGRSGRRITGARNREYGYFLHLFLVPPSKSSSDTVRASGCCYLFTRSLRTSRLETAGRGIGEDFRYSNSDTSILELRRISLSSRAFRSCFNFCCAPYTLYLPASPLLIPLLSPALLFFHHGRHPVCDPIPLLLLDV